MKAVCGSAYENPPRGGEALWYKSKEDKKGDKRQEIEVKTCFAPLLRWILSWWPPDEKRIAIGLDATTLTDRFTILAISVLYRGCAIPIAWKILIGNQKGSWKPHWLALLKDLDEVMPSDWTVIALTDRGLYAKWLYQAIKKLGWHPFMRINKQGTYRPEGQASFRPLKNCVPTKGSNWAGKATCFKTNPLKCTLLACWEEGYDHPWLIVTDLAPEQANVCWYGLRTWIECGFKDHKRGGWQWQNSKITDPARAERIWLAIAVATLWAVSVGGEADANMPASGSSSFLRLISPVVLKRIDPLVPAYYPVFDADERLFWLLYYEARVYQKQPFYPKYGLTSSSKPH